MAEQLNIWEMIYPKKIIEKPIKQNDSFGLCPICKQDLGRTNYCETCGQRLDWSDEE